MALDGIRAEPVVDGPIIPPAFDGVVIAGTEEQVLFRVPLDILHVLGVPTGDSHAVVLTALPSVGITYPYSLVSAACG
jgi:hypothetical protein